MRSLATVLTVLVRAMAFAAPWSAHRRAEAETLAHTGLLRLRARQIASWTEESQRLSTLLAQGRADGSEADLREVLRLRGEIGRLRPNVARLDWLRADNERLRKQAREAANTAAGPDPQKVQAYWPKSQLENAGLADPRSALQSVLTAMSQGDTNALAASVTPKAWSRMAKDGWYEHLSPTEEISASAKSIAYSLALSSGFFLVGQQSPADDQTILDVFFEGEGQSRMFLLKKAGDQWQFETMGRAGAGYDDLGAPAWP